MDFRAHMATHLLLGMAVPLLLVAAAPVTLLLRALPVGAARRVTWLLATRPLQWLTEPVVAAVLTVGGLWVLYGTPVYALSQFYGWVHLLVHAHLLISGYLMTTALVGRDPMPHRRSHGYRAVVLVAVLAAHGILAKALYAVPPAGVPVELAETGAMIMYYGGDALSLVLIVWLCAEWYRGRQRARGPSAPSSSTSPSRDGRRGSARRNRPPAAVSRQANRGPGWKCRDSTAPRASSSVGPAAACDRGPFEGRGRSHDRTRRPTQGRGRPQPQPSPPAQRRRVSIDAGRLWAGGAATALVAALIAVVGEAIASNVLDVGWPGRPCCCRSATPG